MNMRNTTFFTTLIHDKLASLANENLLGQEAQKIVTLDQQAVGRLSRMDALQAQAMAKAGQQRRNIQAMALQQALLRLEDDTFGFCEECGDDIARKRLEFDPAARRCISCANG